MGDAFLVLSCDLSVEGVHYRREWLTPEEAGWRAATAALSDLAAEGAETIGVLVALGMPAASADESVDFMKGVGDAAEAAGGTVLGGDLSTAPVWTCDVTAVGRASNPVTRAGARDGDGVWVTGSLGAARAAVRSWEAGREPEAGARHRFARPAARIAAGRWLAAAGAHAMMDLSDGLAGDIGHLAAASEVGIDIALELVPVADSARREAEAAQERPAHFAAAGGEDYELLVAMPDGFGDAEAAEFTAASGLPLVRVGRVGGAEGARLLENGTPVSLEGFDHFR
jgi:thiamine-monophosphate kinase